MADQTARPAEPVTDFSKLKVEELRQYAADHAIDLSGANLKQEIIDQIEAADAAPPAAVVPPEPPAATTGGGEPVPPVAASVPPNVPPNVPMTVAGGVGGAPAIPPGIAVTQAPPAATRDEEDRLPAFVEILVHNPKFNGIRAGVSFAAGRGVTNSRRAAAACQGLGYAVRQIA